MKNLNLIAIIIIIGSIILSGCNGGGINNESDQRDAYVKKAQDWQDRYLNCDDVLTENIDDSNFTIHNLRSILRNNMHPAYEKEKIDYWEVPCDFSDFEMVATDCEGQAAYWYGILRRHVNDDMLIMRLYNMVERDHTVLVVHINGTNWIIDDSGDISEADYENSRADKILGVYVEWNIFNIY